jgi:hypothetical protein
MLATSHAAPAEAGINIHIMSDISSSVKPEFCLPSLRGSNIACVALKKALFSTILCTGEREKREGERDRDRQRERQRDRER